VAILTYAQRQAHWEWCRDYIDREAIYRAADTHPPIPSKKPGGTYVWQFYLRRATFNAEVCPPPRPAVLGSLPADLTLRAIAPRHPVFAIKVSRRPSAQAAKKGARRRLSTTGLWHCLARRPSWIVRIAGQASLV
jgi:hypothetical protein